MRYIVIEDNELEQQSLIETIGVIAPHFELVQQFTDIFPAIAWLQQNTVDVIFSDIELGDQNAIETFKKFSQNAPVVLVSNHPEFALESYEISALYFISKPVSAEKLLKVLEKLNSKSQIDNADVDFCFIPENGVYTKIYYADISHIEAQENYVQIHLVSGKKMVLSNLTQFLNQLNNEFVRIHKRYAVNINHIAQYDAETLKVNERLLPIGVGYKDEVLNILRHQTIKRKK